MNAHSLRQLDSHACCTSYGRCSDDTIGFGRQARISLSIRGETILASRSARPARNNKSQASRIDASASASIRPRSVIQAPPAPQEIVLTARNAATVASFQHADALSIEKELPLEFLQLLDPTEPVKLPAWLSSMAMPSPKQLDQLITKLGKKEATWRRSIILFEWLKSLPISQTDSPLDTRFCTTLIRICSDHKEPLTSLAIYEWMRAPINAGGAGLSLTLFTYEAVMRAALKANMLEKTMMVWSHIEKQQGLIPDCRISVLHIEACVRLGRTDHALSTYSKLRNALLTASSPSLSVHLYVAAMRAACEGGSWKQSLDIWEEMQQDLVQPSGHAYSAAISACASGNQWQRASSLFTEMVSSGIKPDVVSCTALLTALASSGEADRAEAILKWMLDNEIKPNNQTYRVLLMALAKGGKCDRAVEVLFKMQLPEWGAVKPNAYIYSALLKSLGDQGKWRLAEAVFRQEEERELKSMASQAKKAQERKSMLERGFDSGSNEKSPLASYTEDLLNRAMPALTDLGGDVKGNELLSLPFLSLSSTFASFSSPSLELSKRPMRVEPIPASISNSYPIQESDIEYNHTQPPIINEVVCGALMIAYERSGLWSEAVKVLGRARRLGLDPNTIMYNIAISAAGKAGQLDVVERLFLAAKSPDSVTYETVIASYGLCGRSEEAELWFSKLIQAGHRPRDYAYCGLIAAYSLSGDIDSALAVKKRMSRRGKGRAELHSVHVYNTLLAACERCGRTEEALRLVAAMKKDGVKPNALTQSLVTLLGKKGVADIEGQQAALASLSLAVAAAAAAAISRGLF